MPTKSDGIATEGNLWRAQRPALHAAAWVVLLSASPSPQTAAAAESSSSAALIESLREATHDGQELERNSLIEQLRGQGTNVFPAIREAMKDADASLRMNLIDVVRGISGDEPVEVLLEIAVRDPDSNVSRMAANCIENRVIRRPLSPEEWVSINNRIKAGSSAEAKTWGFILAHSGLVAEADVVEMIVDRFLRDVRDPALDVRRPQLGGYMTGKALALNSYLRAFFFIDSALVTPDLTSRMTATSDRAVIKWLTIALGMAGDATQTEALKGIVEDTGEDVSVRAEALRAYARAASTKAMPLLESLVDDRTPGPDPVRPPLGVVARSELYWLRHPERRREVLGK